MNKTIHIREAVTPEEVERFWQELHAYHARDIFPDPAEEDRAYFLDDSQYRAAVQRIHDREGDRCYYLLFRREGRDIGFALTDGTVPFGGRQVLRHGVLCAAGVPGRRDRHRLRPSAAGLGSGSGSAVWGTERRRPPGASDSGAVWASGPMAGTSGVSR